MHALLPILYYFSNPLPLTLQQQKQIIKIIQQPMNNSNISGPNDISYNSSDEQIQVFRPPQTMLPAQMDMEINQTADSFRQIANREGDDGSFNDVAKLFSTFYKQCLVRRRTDEKLFQKSPIFDPFRKMITVYNPKPDLYFLPKTIIFDQSINTIKLRDSIVGMYRNRVNVQIPNERPNQLSVTIHSEDSLCSYAIRSVPLYLKYPHSMPELFDQELSLNPLFEFYEANYERSCRFGETCGVLLYWAYQKRLLNSDYLTESALKMIVIFFYFITEEVPNIITYFCKEKRQKIQSLREMYSVNKKLECELDDQLFDHVNFSIQEKKSFYIESQRKYSKMTRILPVPYPVSKQDVETFTKKIKQHEHTPTTRNKEVYPVVKFFKMMEYLQNCIKREQRVIFDFVTSRKGVTTVPDTDFNIEIKHPVFRNNLCEKLTNDPSKLAILKRQISNVVDIYRKNKATPAEALCRVFEKIQ